ncbi:MAG: metallophosphoesterase family protein [Armatimonadota bacterium]
MRIGLLTDIHYAEKDPAGGRHYRESRRKVEAAVVDFAQAKVDILVQMGDLVDTPAVPDPAVELGFVRTMASVLDRAAPEKFGCLGNHCVQSFSKSSFLRAFGQRRSTFSIDRGGWHLVFLDGCHRHDGADYDAGNFAWDQSDIPEVRRDWLRRDLASNLLPVAVFCHQRLDEPTNRKFAVASRLEVREILARHRAAIVFMGHSHENDLQVHDGVRYAAVQAVVEGSGPGSNAYSVIELLRNGDIAMEGREAHAPHPLHQRR